MKFKALDKVTVKDGFFKGCSGWLISTFQYHNGPREYFIQFLDKRLGTKFYNEDELEINND